ncbi:Uncharacterized protein APZ42_020091 [Daphnia magna]|uniref:Methyltransferase domain-containing protein n=1 Tax=Daphnia magna TaxID=35525 RepID=A0A162CE54_9CRUS|nr:Uncharacterized protein APZ42_020091 [Daphnia magna]
MVRLNYTPFVYLLALLAFLLSLLYFFGSDPTRDNKITGVNCLSDSYWDTLVSSDSLTGVQIMTYFEWSNGSSCPLVHDFGGKFLKNPSGKDGQKSICLDPKVAPQPTKCLVYSFGISNEWSFDEEMEEYGCEVFAFDPSMKMKPHNHSRGIHFYNWGLGDRDVVKIGPTGTQWQMHSLSSVYNMLSHHHGPNVIDYVKMDIEGSEWKVLTDIIESGMLSRIRQLALEVHLPDYPVEEFRKLIRLIRTFESKGMVRFDSKYNPWYLTNFTHLQLWRQPAGYEIAWYNSKLLHPGF